jgi:Ca2+-binding EF-hand superfamily protein
MRDLGLEIAGNQVQYIVSQVNYLAQGTIQYTDFLLATLDAKSKMSDQVLYETFKYFDMDNHDLITKENMTKAFSMAGI